MPKNFAPIIFLLGISNAGKTTICKAITEQSKNTAFADAIKIWGHDQELIRIYEDLGPQMFGKDPRFNALIEKGLGRYEILSAIWGEPLLDLKSKKSLPMDENFDKNLPQFLQDTAGRYNEEMLRGLKAMADEEKLSGAFKEAAKIIDDHEFITKSAIDRAIENSQQGKATVLDGVPLGFVNMQDPSQDRIMEKLQDYLKSKNFDGPVQTVLVHLHPKEIKARQQQRNIEAAAEGGDPYNRRLGDGPIRHQYSHLFGKKSADGTALNQGLSGIDIIKYADSFNKGDAFLAITQGKEIKDALGFEDGANFLELGTKVKADLVVDHQQQSTAEIATKILGLIAHGFAESQYKSGVLLFEKGDPEKGEIYLKQAQENGYDVAKALQKQMEGTPKHKQIIFEKALSAINRGHESTSSHELD